jgi:cell division protein FtsI (penicillin-binding protein 3)
VEREIEKAVKLSGARSGSAVILNPHTGDILAMANYPTFDPNGTPGRVTIRWRAAISP